MTETTDTATDKAHTIAIGRYKIGGTPAEHWAVKIDTEWFEVQGTGVKFTGLPNIIDTHNDDSKYTNIEYYNDGLTVSRQAIVDWIDGWVKIHNVYKFTGDNCQKMIAELFKHFWNFQINTQNSAIGNTLIGTGLLAGAVTLIGGPIGLAFLAGTAIVTGAVVRGSHKPVKIIDGPCRCYECKATVVPR